MSDRADLRERVVAAVKAVEPFENGLQRNAAPVQNDCIAAVCEAFAESENQPINDAGGDAGTNRRQGGEESVARDASETSTVNQRPDPASPPQPIAATPRDKEYYCGRCDEYRKVDAEGRCVECHKLVPLVATRTATPQDQTAQPICGPEYVAWQQKYQEWLNEETHELRGTQSAHRVGWLSALEYAAPIQQTAQPVAWYMPLLGKYTHFQWGAARPDAGNVTEWHPLYASVQPPPGGQDHSPLQRRLVALDQRITEALEYCEDREDIVDGEFGPLPNDFMHLATILKGRVA